MSEPGATPPAAAAATLHLRELTVARGNRVVVDRVSLDVPPGEFRSLTLQEIDRLRTACNKPMAKTKPSVA